jgi:TPR repeat protein
MRRIRDVSFLLVCICTMGNAAAQGFGKSFHRDELLVPSLDSSGLDARRDAQRLYLLAKNFWHGENGLHQDREQAIALFKQSARMDYPPALYYLSEVYFAGEETPIDVAAGNRLLRRATQLGLRDAESRIRSQAYFFSETLPVPTSSTPVVSVTVPTIKLSPLNVRTTGMTIPAL